MKQKDFLFFLISICIIIVAWVSFSVYHSSITSTIPESLMVQINPIAPQFSTAAIDKLKKRQKIIPLYFVENSPPPQASPSPLLSSPSAFPQNTQSPKASEEATLVR